MAEGDIHVYQAFKELVMEGVYDLINDAVAAALVSGYTLDEDGHRLWGDAGVSANEIADASYTRQNLASKTVTAVGTGVGTAVKGQFDAADVTFVSLTGTDPNYLILFDDTPTNPADPLICAMEIATVTNGGDFVISWNANGIIRIS